jgi:hypothetical protein
MWQVLETFVAQILAFPLAHDLLLDLPSIATKNLFELLG